MLNLTLKKAMAEKSKGVTTIGRRTRSVNASVEGSPIEAPKPKPNNFLAALLMKHSKTVDKEDSNEDFDPKDMMYKRDTIEINQPSMTFG